MEDEKNPSRRQTSKEEEEEEERVDGFVLAVNRCIDVVVDVTVPLSLSVCLSPVSTAHCGGGWQPSGV